MKRTGEKPDGCATFWRKSQFEIVDELPVTYFVSPGSMLDRDNVGQ